MTTSDMVYFLPFRFESQSGRLWHGEEERPLRHKTAAVLHYLVHHAGQVVSKDELLAAVWPEVTVSEAVLTVCINELRRALADDPQRPRFIATVHRRGYRFLPAITPQPVASSQYPGASRPEENQEAKIEVHSPTPNTQYPAPYFVGREGELAQLQQWWELALGGRRQVVFIAGEPGIGKTTLIDRFLARISHGQEHECWIGRGQCVEQYGEGEAYLPILEALAQMCRGPDGQQVRTVLRRYAPTWLLQMPSLVEATEWEALKLQVAGATRERMLREMADAVEALTAERGLVIVCEDLHASDRSTVELLAYLAQRRGPARLLVLGTYRPAEVIVHGHPLRQVVQELHGRQQCQYLSLELLSQAAVRAYLAQRLAPGSAPPSLAAEVYQRTEGNALFMVTVVEYLLQQELLRKEDGQWRLQGRLQHIGVPESVRLLIEKQVEQLSVGEQRVLEVASIAGVEFSAAAVSAGLPPEGSQAVEEQCEQLSRRTPFLRVSGLVEWPDGTVTIRYGFRHALYQEVVYERMSPGRRSQLHQRIGERLALAYGPRTGEVAAELAMHFERGRDMWRAVQYLQQAGENAVRRHAHHEALTLFSKGLALLSTLPETPERAWAELALQLAVGPVWLASQSQGHREVERAYTRAQELCLQLGEARHLFHVLAGLRRFYAGSGQHARAREIGQRLLDMAQQAQDSALLSEAHYSLGNALFLVGELPAARDHLEQALTLHDSTQAQFHIQTYGGDPGILAQNYVAITLWLLGYPDQAGQRMRAALTRAETLAHPASWAQTLLLAATASHFQRQIQAAREWAERTVTLSTEQGLPYWLAGGLIRRGWALTAQGQGEEGLAQMHDGLAACAAVEIEAWRSYHLALLAEGWGTIGQPEEGLNVLAKAFVVVENTGERFYEAELWRLKGQLTLQQSSVQRPASSVANTQHPAPYSLAEAEAETCFQKAIEIARQQQAKSLELRAVTSLSRLWQQQGKAKEAHLMLAEIYDWFTEGFNTRDLQEAKALLKELSSYQRTPNRPKAAKNRHRVSQ